MFKVYGARIDDLNFEIDSLIKYTQEISCNKGITIQLFDANLIYGIDHLESAFEHAKRAYTQKRETAESLGMEILLYASGEYQIKNAIHKLGIKKSTDQIAVLIYVKNKMTEDDMDMLLNDIIQKFEFSRDDDVIKGNIDTLESFGITKEELSAVPKDKWLDLILEKVALVDIIK